MKIVPSNALTAILSTIPNHALTQKSPKLPLIIINPFIATAFLVALTIRGSLTGRILLFHSVFIKSFLIKLGLTPFRRHM